MRRTRLSSVSSTVKTSHTGGEGLLRARILLMLLTSVLVSGPLTERLFAWDHFLQTGRDFEFGVLGLLLIFGMVLLIAQSMRPALTFAAQLSRWLRWRSLRFHPSSSWQAASLHRKLPQGIETWHTQPVPMRI